MSSRPDPRDLIAQHDDEALKLEKAAVSAAAGPVRSAVQQVFAWLLASWARTFGKPRAEGSGERFSRLVADLAARIEGIPLDPVPVLRDYAARARALGVRQGTREAGVPGASASLEISRESARAIDTAARSSRAKLAEAVTLVRAKDSGTLVDVQRRIAAMHQAASVLERAARTVANRELNAGIAAVAEKAGARLVWVAERDACVACLALSGRVVDVGKPFNWRLTFGGKAYQPMAYNPAGKLVPAPLLMPPRHPNCRCRVSPWLGHDTAGALSVTHDWADAIRDALAKGDTVRADAARRAAAAAADSASFDLPAALRREAERSVLRGDALPSESANVRIQAADRLLNRIGSAKNSRSPSGWAVPASVKKRAERAVKRGAFTR